MEAFEQRAKEWLHKCGTAYRFDSNENEKKMLFTLEGSDDSISFSVNCPDEPEGKVTVWSDCAALHEDLSVILEFCESESPRSMSEILDKMDAAVTKLQQRIRSKDDDVDDDDDDDDDDDLNNDYYADADNDAETEQVQPEREEEEEDEENFFGAAANPVAFQRLSKDLRSMKKEAHKYGIEGSPRGDNLFIWDVKLTGFPTDSQLGKDLQKFATTYSREPVVYLEMQFPGDYPMSPPFVRVTRPRFKFLTGHVTIGGSICMEMLTKSGWRPTNDIESILVQIRSEIMSDKNARLDPNPDREYGKAEAEDAFKRMVQRYGWNR